MCTSPTTLKIVPAGAKQYVISCFLCSVSCCRRVWSKFFNIDAGHAGVCRVSRISRADCPIGTHAQCWGLCSLAGEDDFPFHQFSHEAPISSVLIQPPITLILTLVVTSFTLKPPKTKRLPIDPSRPMSL